MRLIAWYQDWLRRPPAWVDAWSKQLRIDIRTEVTADVADAVYRMLDQRMGTIPVPPPPHNPTLHDVRIANGLTTAVLAEKLGVPEDAVFFVESGERHVHPKHRERILAWVERMTANG